MYTFFKHISLNVEVPDYYNAVIASAIVRLDHYVGYFSFHFLSETSGDKSDLITIIY